MHRCRLALAFLLLLAVPALADCPGELKTVEAAVKTAGAYRFAMSFGGNPGEILFDVVLPDRNRMKLGDIEGVVVGETTWVKQGESWIVSPNPAVHLGPDHELDNLDMDAVANVACTDAELEGRAVRHFSYLKRLMDGANERPIDLYVDPSTGLPVQQYIGKGEPIEGKIRYTFDPSIVIEPPL
ncbi:MAG TPA: hypothetical protein VJS40_08825 [Aestuariivirgaceae bacterium]|nr:hypothetical protein [Aestuariivirgaceae bacterium]